MSGGSGPLPTDFDPPLVSRGGLKLHAAFEEFGSLGLDASGAWAVDLGCSTGGFTDVLLRRGAACVHAVDTAYGELAWRLRQDARVVVLERSNALHVEVPTGVAERGGVELAVIDLGWTPQARALPAARRWLRPGGQIVTLIKPHYEVPKDELGKGGVLDAARAEDVTRRVVDALPELGFVSLGLVESPVTGGKGKRRGNREWLALVEAAGAD